MKTLVYAALALCAALGPAAAQDRPEPWLELEWSSKPSGDEMAKYYPDRASREERGGWAIMSCRIDDDRRLTKCKIAAEAPEGDEFGKAALAVSSRFRVLKSKDGRPVAGGRVRIPIHWTLEGDQGPPKTYPAGEPSMVVKVAEPGVDKRRTFPCPSKTAPDRACLALPITWATRPEIEDLAELIRKAGDGASILECSIEVSGALDKCRADNSASGISEAELLSLAKLFTAPPALDDKTPTASQRVMLTFDWKVLRKALEVFEAT